MKKSIIILALTVVALLIVAVPAMALQAPYTHGDFATNSKGCGDCHVTHSAGAAKLLNTTSSFQTTFCIGCHGKLSPFDVRIGQIVKDSADTPANPIATRWDWAAVTDTDKTANTNFSLAGGFEYGLNFDLIGGDPASATQATSVHNVRGLVDAGINIANVSTYGWVNGDQIPGGTSSALDFECGSCHDPHAGGAYANDQADKNPRLLREDILARNNMRVKMKFNADNVPTEYTEGINNWCGACHDVFDTSSLADTWYGSAQDGAAQAAARTGTNLIGGRTKYMHLMNVYVDPAQHATGANTYLTKYLALSDTGNDDTNYQLSCLTCHRAHGSSATVSGLTWNRYTNYKDGGGAATATGTGSALLRLPDRDVCYACHGAATINHDETH